MREERLWLHVGCGQQHWTRYVNIDKYETRATDMVAPADHLEFPDNSVDVITTSHMIEHLTPREFRRALREWHRVLKPGGVLRITCPNFELYVREWLEGDYEWRWGWGIVNIFGWTDRGEGMRHRTGFTKERLEDLCKKAGFKTIFCQIGFTRPLTAGTVEYRSDGDLWYEGIKNGL